MAQYIALHTLKKSAEEVMKAITEASPEFARAMAAGKTPAKCIKTWNPIHTGGQTTFSACGKPTNLKTSWPLWGRSSII